MARVKLTDAQKKKIIADYINNNNFHETGRLNGVHPSTVKRLVESDYDKDLQQKAIQKKEDNTKDILSYLDSIAEEQKEIIKLSMNALKSKLENVDMFTNVKDIVTVYGIIYDKAIKSEELKIRKEEIKYKQSADKETLDKLDELLEAQRNAYMD